MYRHWSPRHGKPMVIIHPGEYVVTAEDCVLCTVLGSCVAVALYDRVAGLGGLNHFMLPGVMRRSLEASQSAKYGMYAMELLVNGLLEQGARRERLEAKAFGGGSVLGEGQEAASGISRSNVEFVLEYLATEGIPLRSSDLGGGAGAEDPVFPRGRPGPPQALRGQGRREGRARGEPVPRGAREDQGHARAGLHLRAGPEALSPRAAGPGWGARVRA